MSNYLKEKKRKIKGSFEVITLTGNNLTQEKMRQKKNGTEKTNDWNSFVFKNGVIQSSRLNIETY